MKAAREEALAALTADGLAVEPTRYAPLGLRVNGRPLLAKHPWLADGRVEVQDEGSQLIALLVAPKRNDLVVDFCAGAGGKTLALGALMRSQGRLYAFDVIDRRLANMKPRLARSGLSNVHPELIAHERDTRIKRLSAKADRVLVDAPCTGFGTLRRNPDLKWRHTESALGELTAKQTSILDAAATLVKPGGRLVYATCSLLPEENEAIVDAFPRPPRRLPRGRCSRRARTRRDRARHRPAAQGRAGHARLRRVLRRGAGATLNRSASFPRRREPSVPRSASCRREGGNPVS